ncbi:NAD/NADP-dependent betaine aldehyde dehydrogenase [Streptomyces griseoloalbus]
MMMAMLEVRPGDRRGQHGRPEAESDTTPASTVLIAEILGSILPKGVFNVICGDRDTGRMMVEHPTPAMASITGSVRAGMWVAESASKDLKRVEMRERLVIARDITEEGAAEEFAGRWNGIAGL